MIDKALNTPIEVALKLPLLETRIELSGFVPPTAPLNVTLPVPAVSESESALAILSFKVEANERALFVVAI